MESCFFFFCHSSSRTSFFLFICIWERTRWPAARAAMRLSSPASTVPATIRARRSAFSPGRWVLAPLQAVDHRKKGYHSDRNKREKYSMYRMPSSSRAADWPGRCVPPPTVPTSIEGIVTDARRSPANVRLCTEIGEFQHRTIHSDVRPCLAG